jgi:integrase
MPDTQTRRRRKNTPRLRDGVMKRGNTWSYVIRVKDPETGLSKPRWVGGFATEQEAKAARDKARVRARQGQYIDRASITVAAYLDQWLEAHAVEVKPKTLHDYRHLINRHVRPQIGALRLQAITPARLTKLYRELATSGGRDGAGLSPRTVEYVHAVLRKAFRDAVVVDQILPSNPVERAKRPARPAPSRGACGRPLSSGPSSTPPGNTGCSPSTASPRTPALGAASCSTSAGRTLT